MYKIIQKRKTWLTGSSILVALSLLVLLIWGLNFGIDFTGGSLLEIKFKIDRPETTEVRRILGGLDLGSLSVQPVDDDGMILRFQDISEEKHQQVINILNGKKIADEIIEDGVTEEAATSTDSKAVPAPVETNDQEIDIIEELRYESVGPSIGAELKRKSLYAIFLVLLAIVVYIAWVFRKVSKPVASWKYGITAIIALFHDVIITLGIFAILGKFLNIEISTPFVAAILTVLGYSVNDTIVVFDRIRENLPKSDEDFENTINTSVNQTIRRSINTSVTTLLVLLSILFFGGSTIRDFVLALAIGVFIGTYSSIFLASPLLVVWEKIKSRNS